MIHFDGFMPIQNSLEEAQMRRALYIFLAVLFLPAVTQTARADTINVSTGLDASGNVIGSGGVKDANWVVSGADFETGARPAQTVFPNNIDFCEFAHFACFATWIANDSSSDWIAYDPNVTQNGEGTYILTFSLSAAAASTATMSGSWLIDDLGILSLNGHVISILPQLSEPLTPMTPFSVPAGSGFFNSGLNALVMQITGTDHFEEGVRLNGSVSYGTTATTPEPSSLLLIGTSLLGFAARLRRKLFGVSS